MLGRDHLLLTIATVSLVLAPLFTLYPTAVLVALVGTAIGSLIPDADSPDAAIFHTKVSGLRGGIGGVLNSIGVLYPVFGYVTKYLIYKPSVKFYDAFIFTEMNIEERHRGFLHSFLGLGTATVLTGVYRAFKGQEPNNLMSEQSDRLTNQPTCLSKAVGVWMVKSTRYIHATDEPTGVSSTPTPPRNGRGFRAIAPSNHQIRSPPGGYTH